MELKDSHLCCWFPFDCSQKHSGFPLRLYYSTLLLASVRKGAAHTLTRDFGGHFEINEHACAWEMEGGSFLVISKRT